jgi:hypothetical protein
MEEFFNVAFGYAVCAFAVVLLVGCTLAGVVGHQRPVVHRGRALRSNGGYPFATEAEQHQRDIDIEQSVLDDIAAEARYDAAEAAAERGEIY